MKIFNLLSLCGALLCASAAATAQTMVQDPYSMMGYGLLNDHVSSAQRSMGGVGYAMRSSRQINVMNPASYAAIDSMTFLFDIGLDAGSMRASEAAGRSKRTLGGLNYITMQVPVKSWLGATAGLLPYSSVGYNFGKEIINGTSQYQGNGGISEAVLGVGVRPVKGLSAGVNVSYLFGNIINDTYALVGGSSNAMLYETVLQVRDYNLQFGVQYGLTLNRRHTLTAGLTYSPSRSMHGHGYGVKYLNITDGSGSIERGTIGYTALKHRFSVPETWGVGVAYDFDSRLFVEADFTYQPWSKARFMGIEGFTDAINLADRYRGALGVQFKPAQRGGYIKRVSYRVGGYFNRDYITIGSNNVKEYGLSCGFGLPTPLGRTAINLGFEYKHRATSPVATLTENQFLVTLGININEVWFMPRRLR